MDKKKYIIGGKTFVQRPLVLGQWKELGEIIKQVAIPAELSPSALVAAVGDNVFIALAIILTEEGKPLKGKDLPLIADEIEYGITPETAIEAISDFFTCNPIASSWQNLQRLIFQLNEKIQTAAIGLASSVSSSAAVISQSATGSSGTSPLPTPAAGQSE